jgi:tellurite resistance protein
MIPEFDKLSSSETELMFKAPILACILIAGADGHIDRNEIQGAIEVSRKKQKRAQANLLEFYRLVGEDFEDKLKIVIQSYSHDASRRNPQIIEELAQLNEIFPKIPTAFAVAFYGSIKEIAHAIAESSGGLLGINKIGDEEAELVNLPMIKSPVA